MKFLLPFSFFFLLTACKQGKKDQPAPAEKKDTMVASPPADSTGSTAGPGSKIDIESLGPLKLGQPAADVLKILEAPSQKSKPVEWGADGLLHEDWKWTAEALELNFSSEKGAAAGTQQLFSITASEPNTFKTNANIGIGSSRADIEAAYQKDINKEESTKEQVVVGSVYGGILFTLRNDKVIHIFVGAAAE